MDLQKLKTLIDLVSDSNVTELEITEAEGRVRIVKAAAPVQFVAAAPAAGAAMTALAPQSPAAPPASTAAAAPAAALGHAVKSPMVGTFYRASGPDAKPFVEIGSVVKEGETICIIEAMKILNEIETDRAGTILEILCDNGQPVEYGQPLFLIG